MDMFMFHFIHIGKTAGSSYKRLIKKYRDRIQRYRIKNYTSHGFTLMDIPKGQRVFFGLRDPITRFVSAFNARKRSLNTSIPKRKGTYKRLRKAERVAYSTFDTASDLAEALSSSDKKRRSQARVAMRKIPHVKSCYTQQLSSIDYIKERESDILHISFYETLERDFNIIKNKLGLPDEAKLEKENVNVHSYSTYLSPLAITNLNLHYKDSIEIYNYCKYMIEDRIDSEI